LRRCMKSSLRNPMQWLYALGGLAALTLTAGCHHRQQQVYVPPPPVYRRTQPRPTVATTQRPAPVPAPAHIDGKPLSVEVGMSSWYGPPYNNQRGANGEIYDQNAMTAAHRTLPMGTIVRVTNLDTGQSAVVKITDRGPFVHGRTLDLSLAAAKQTGVYRAGVARVKIEVFSQPPSAATAGKWCVQVGAFTNPDNAIKLKDDLSHRYTTAKVIEFPGPTGHWVRVNTPQGDKSRATQIAESIRPKEPGAEAYLVRLD
jgi:rare lipoprotein A